jgi:hypothetical protein
MTGPHERTLRMFYFSGTGNARNAALASPTHGFNFPPITLAFLLRFPRTTWGNRV